MVGQATPGKGRGGRKSKSGSSNGTPSEPSTPQAQIRNSDSIAQDGGGAQFSSGGIKTRSMRARRARSKIAKTPKPAAHTPLKDGKDSKGVAGAAGGGNTTPKQQSKSNQNSGNNSSAKQTPKAPKSAKKKATTPRRTTEGTKHTPNSKSPKKQ